MTKVALLGFGAGSSNMGCVALTYSFVEMLKNICDCNDLEIHVYGYEGLGKIQELYPEIKFIYHRLHLKKISYCLKMKKEFDQMDCIFDVTFGDGFSDIYGKKWNAITDLAKQIAINSKTPFVLLPQTYGPYYQFYLRKWAHILIKKADKAYSRDAISAKEVNSVIGDKVVEATDLAFLLPFNKDIYSFEDNKFKIGFNVSSLLWFGGHSDTIHLGIDYKEYCKQVIDYCINEKNYDVFIIPHVIDNENYDAGENDVKACTELHNMIPETVMAPSFNTPIEAKSYISNMDIFLGARMHATIGALSSGVPCIPLSYSKKFEGLFGNLDYPYVVSAITENTKTAVDMTKEYICQYDNLVKARELSMGKVDEKLMRVERDIKEYLVKQ